MNDVYYTEVYITNLCALHFSFMWKWIPQCCNVFAIFFSSFPVLELGFAPSSSNKTGVTGRCTATIAGSSCKVAITATSRSSRTGRPTKTASALWRPTTGWGWNSWPR